jgi:hypothetical protein
MGTIKPQELGNIQIMIVNSSEQRSYISSIHAGVEHLSQY